MKIRLTILIPFIMSLLLAANAFAADEVITTENGLRFQDLVVGTGVMAEVGNVATIHLSSWLDDYGQKGVMFFNSHDQGQPIKFKVGTDRVMKAWNIGVVGMKVGGKRRLMVPAKQGYGSKGIEGIVPPNSALILEIELVEVE